MSRTNFTKTFLILSLVCLASCGGSSTTPTSGSTDATFDDLALFIKWAGHAWTDVAANLDSSKDLTDSILGTCTDGGTMTRSGNTITITECTEEDGGVTYVTSGTYTITESVSLTTHEWNFTQVAAGSTTFSGTGSISFNTTDNLIAFDYSGVFSSSRTFRLTGVVTNNAGSSDSVTFSVLLNGSAYQDGLFDGTVDLDALTSTQVDTACSADDDAVCATLECSNDFQCQLFADDDPNDDYTTGNIECSAGCCAIIADVSECPGSSPCSNAFECQLFADDDPDDEFTTSNVTCGSDGCCATTS